LGAPDELGRLRTTLVLFSHHTKVQDLVQRLAARYPSDTPIALLCEASCPTEEVITGTLGTILQKLHGKKLPHLHRLYAGDALNAGSSQAQGLVRVGSRQGKETACPQAGRL
jgi:precorrin-4 methylase